MNEIPPPIKKNWKAKLDKMQVNESIIINNDHNNSVKAAISTHFNRSRQKQFVTAKQTEKYFRVWRVK